MKSFITRARRMGQSMLWLVVAAAICRTSQALCQNGAFTETWLLVLLNSLLSTILLCFSSTRGVVMGKYMTRLPYRGITGMCWHVFMIVAPQQHWLLSQQS